jgi:hypothetical protein
MDEDEDGEHFAPGQSLVLRVLQEGNPSRGGAPEWPAAALAGRASELLGRAYLTENACAALKGPLKRKGWVQSCKARGNKNVWSLTEAVRLHFRRRFLNVPCQALLLTPYPRGRSARRLTRREGARPLVKQAAAVRLRLRCAALRCAALSAASR